jgi:hypothetical protein
MSLHLGTKARWTQLQPVPDLVDLIEDLFGRLIRHGASTSVAEDKSAVSLHINASRCGSIHEMLLPFFALGVALEGHIHASNTMLARKGFSWTHINAEIVIWIRERL